MAQRLLPVLIDLVEGAAAFYIYNEKGAGMNECFGLSLIEDSVGNNLRNNEDDVFAVKNRLARVGVFDRKAGVEPHGFITREVDDGIKMFQRRNNLREDGLLFPGGET